MYMQGYRNFPTVTILTDSSNQPPHNAGMSPASTKLKVFMKHSPEKICPPISILQLVQYEYGLKESTHHHIPAHSATLFTAHELSSKHKLQGRMVIYTIKQRHEHVSTDWLLCRSIQLHLSQHITLNMGPHDGHSFAKHGNQFNCHGFQPRNLGNCSWDRST